MKGWWTTPNSNRTQHAVCQGDWKLVVDANHLLLFNLRDDIGERRDRTAQRPDIVLDFEPCSVTGRAAWMATRRL